MTRLGLELGPDAIRAVVLGGDQPRTLEVDWTPSTREAAVADLRDRVGSAATVAVAVHPALLRIRRLRLPPLPAPERRRALALESDRYFASEKELAFSFPGADGLVFAAPEAELNRWIDALGPLGPLVRIEPAAAALARALSESGVRDAELVRPIPDGAEWVRLQAGEIAAARRLFGPREVVTAEAMAGAAIPAGEASGQDAPPDTGNVAPSVRIYVEPWPDGSEAGDGVDQAPAPDGVPPRFLAAYGAGLDRTESWQAGFVTGSLEATLSRRQLRRRVGVSLALVAALAFAVLSWGAYRDRVEARLDVRIAELRDAAVPVMALEQDVAALQRTLAALDRIEGSGPDVLASLRALTNTLPPDTWLRTVNVRGDEWQIQGTGADAAALIPLLENQPLFEDVRFAAATRRVQTQTESYDDFAIDLRATGPADRP